MTEAETKIMAIVSRILDQVEDSKKIQEKMQQDIEAIKNGDNKQSKKLF
jgi:hypothetical protein